MVLDAGRSSFWESLVVVASHLVHYNTLLQNAAGFITKCVSYFITKCNNCLLQNVLGFLLQNATVLLQNAIFITIYVGPTSYH